MAPNNHCTCCHMSVVINQWCMFLQILNLHHHTVFNNHLDLQQQSLEMNRYNYNTSCAVSLSRDIYQYQVTTSVTIISSQPLSRSSVTRTPYFGINSDYYMTVSVILTMLCIFSCGYLWLLCTVPAFILSSKASYSYSRISLLCPDYRGVFILEVKSLLLRLQKLS